jgi:23S rRNA (uridine2552-2'-O)-methyltransferase
MKIKLSKKHKKESTKWLSRHLNDEYVIKSKQDGYRSRSSYKLLQIDEKFKFLSVSYNVLDLGCAPGGWLQVCKRKCPSNSKILGIDKLLIKKIEGVNFYQEDIFSCITQAKIHKFFDESSIDLLMSDMSPNSTGNKQIDHLRIISLIERVLEISKIFLKVDGTLVMKLFQGGAQGDLIEKMQKSLKLIKYFKPKASRSESSETYLIAKKR